MFAVEPSRAWTGDQIAVLEGHDEIINDGGKFSHRKVGYRSHSQIIHTVDVQKLEMETLEGQLNKKLNPVTVDGFWHIFTIGESSSDFLYVSLCSRTVANCLYDVHFHKKEYEGQELFG